MEDYNGELYGMSNLKGKNTIQTPTKMVLDVRFEAETGHP
jgi:hypothetical protein